MKIRAYTFISALSRSVAVKPWERLTDLDGQWESATKVVSLNMTLKEGQRKNWKAFQCICCVGSLGGWSLGCMERAVAGMVYRGILYLWATNGK